MKSKLHPSTCFPPNPSTPTLTNRLFIHHAPSRDKRASVCLTLVGRNRYIHSIVAALLTARPRTSLECIRIYDIDGQEEGQWVLNDLQGMAALNRTNVRLENVQSYWQTKDSAIVLVHVQHHQLSSENTAEWIQRNATLVELIVSQVCRHSPQATLIIGTEPNELMTYVAWRASNFPSERVFGLGASVKTAETVVTTLMKHAFFIGTESKDDHIVHRYHQTAYWTTAMIVVRIVQALLNGQEFQSNFAVNIASIDRPQPIFLIYPATLGSTYRGIERLLRFAQGDEYLQQRSRLIPYEKMQRQIYLSKSKD